MFLKNLLSKVGVADGSAVGDGVAEGLCAKIADGVEIRIANTLIPKEWVNRLVNLFLLPLLLRSDELFADNQDHEWPRFDAALWPTSGSCRRGFDVFGRGQEYLFRFRIES